MNAKFEGHTRGPWYVQYRGAGYGYSVYSDGSNSPLCGRIDAALMAAAPELLAENERLRARVAELEANEPKPKLIWEINKHSGIDETSPNQELRSQNLLIRADWPVSYYKIMPFRDSFLAYIVGFDKDQNRSIKQIGPRLATLEGAKNACETHKRLTQ